MSQKFFLKFFTLIAVLIVMVIGLDGLKGSGSIASAQNTVTQGSLQVVDPNGTPKAVCPLKHTDVKAQISGFLSRVTINQQFENPFKEKIEAVYTFPLPQNAAVDDMTMVVGDRTVRGKILRRERRSCLRSCEEQWPDRELAEPGAAEHLHAIGGEHPARRANQDYDQLCRD